jgi:hypothetical protein
MTMTKRNLKAATEQAMKGARTAGKDAAQRMAVAADAALIQVGQAAQRRQRNRTMTKALMFAGKAAVIAGTAAATVMAFRAARARKLVAFPKA